MRLLLGEKQDEKWKPICGYEGIYEVSEMGQVRNLSTNKILKPKVEKNGYVRVHLSKNGNAKSVLLHRIVAESFIDNPRNLKTVNHKDENKRNNAVCNLEWCDMSYQNRYGKGALARNKALEEMGQDRDMTEYDPEDYHE